MPPDEALVMRAPSGCIGCPGRDRRGDRAGARSTIPRGLRASRSATRLRASGWRRCRPSIPRSWRGAASVTTILRCRRSGSALHAAGAGFLRHPVSRRAPRGAKVMATEIRVPTLGESITEATVGKWFKQRGDAVKADEPLVELETDKVTLEVNAPGARRAVGSVRPDRRDRVDRRVAGRGVAGVRRAASAPAKAEASAPASKPSAATAMPPAPSAAKIAVENGIDLSAVTGSGKRGQVLEGDVLREIAKSESPNPTGPSPSRPSPAPAAPRLRLRSRRFRPRSPCARLPRRTTPHARSACV